MKKKKLNFSFRISVVDKCNFNCLYCPTETSMENYCPSDSKNRKLNTSEFVNIIIYVLEKYKFTKIVVTGGEPALAQDLVTILKTIKKYNTKVELDTNGSLWNFEKWNEIKNYVDEIKISLDTLNLHLFNKITNTKSDNIINNIKLFINMVKTDNIPITINCVYSKINKNSIKNIIEYSIANNLNLSILDLYYTKETSKFWLDNFLNIYFLEQELKNSFVIQQKEDIYGCKFKYIYYDNKKFIRIKTSIFSTMRDNKCAKCLNYCQEGIFALRLSRQGWLNSCQSNETEGILLTENTKDIENVIDRILTAKEDKNSFKKMLEKNNIENIKYFEMPCIGIIWNSMNQIQKDSAIDIIKKNCEVIDYFDINLKDRYKDFLKDIYIDSHEAPNIPDFKIKSLVDKYENNIIRIISCNIKIKNIKYINDRKGYVYKEIARIKNIIRNKYENEIKNYSFDNIFHLTDDMQEYEYTINILKKYNIRICPRGQFNSSRFFVS